MKFVGIKPPAYGYQAAGNLETAKIVAIYRWNVND
jgi:hypothetical protein